MSDDGFNKLGFYSNAAIYLALAFGSLISTYIMNKIGDIKTMGLGAVLCVPWVLNFLLPAFKAASPESENMFLSETSVYIFMIILSFGNGIGESIMWVA